MKKLYKALACRLGDKVTNLKHVDIFNQQYLDSKSDYPLILPAVFIEFAQANWETMSDGIQQGIVEVKFHVCQEMIGDTFLNGTDWEDNLDLFDLFDEVHLALQDWSPQDEDNHLATQLNRTATKFDHNHNNMLITVMSYKANITDDVVNKAKNLVDVSATLNVERDDELA